MIDYVVANNPDDRILQKAALILNEGGLVCLPTETNWVILADPYKKSGPEKLFQIRHVNNTKHLTLFCRDFKSAQQVAIINDSAFRIMKKLDLMHFTFIFEAQKNITKYLKASKQDREVGIRFSQNKLLVKLLEHFNGILISTHIKHDMLEIEDDSYPIYSAQIEDFFGAKIDLILDPGEYKFSGPTTIIDFSHETAEVIRIGTGDTSLFR